MPKRAGLLCASMGLAALALYAATLAPSIVWEDSANYAALVWDPANTLSKRMIDQYPLYLAILRLIPREPAETFCRRLNLSSACFGALAVSLVCGIGIRVGGTRLSGVLASGAFAVCQSFWHYSVTAKVYPCVLAFLAAQMLLTIEAVARGSRRLFACALIVFGASLLTHRFAFLALPFLVAVQIRHRRTLWHPAMLSAWVVALSPLGLMLVSRLPAAGGLVPWQVWPDPQASGSQKMFTQFSPGAIPKNLALWGFFTVVAFPLGWVAACAGALRLKRERSAFLLPLTILYAADVAIAFDFESLPRLNWYLPGHLSIAAWIAAGVEPLRERLARRLGGAGAAAALACALVAAPPAAYALIVFTPAGNPLRAAMGGAHARADTHYHDRILYYLWPPKNRYDEATEYLRRALDAIPEGAYVVADLQERDALAYTLVLGLAPRPFEVHHFSPQGEQSLRLFREALAREVGARSVLVDAAYVPLARDQGFDARQRDILWEIVPTPTGDGR